VKPGKLPTPEDLLNAYGNVWQAALFTAMATWLSLFSKLARYFITYNPSLLFKFSIGIV
jgi:hypothetical protein